MSEWQDIESADKEHSILAYWPGGEMFDEDRVVEPFVGIARWSKPAHWPERPDSYSWRWHGYHLNFGPGSPTHWMPLPTPPSPDKRS